MTDHRSLTRREFTGFGLAGALALLVACGSDEVASTDGRSGLGSRSGADRTDDVERLVADPALATAVVGATNQFAIDLYALAVEKHENVAFSPLSIAIALAMTSEGARGTSRQQIEDVFHLTGVHDPHGGWNAIDQELASRAGTVTRSDGSTDELALTVVNRLWGQTGFTIEEPFLAVMAAAYGAGVNLLDFAADPEAARVTINAWVAEQTNDRIPELMPPDIIDSYTRLVLTNAIYFKAPWAVPFHEAATRDGEFTLRDGSATSVRLMSTDGAFATQEGGGWQAIELPYAGDQLEMLLVVPDADRFAEVEAQLGEVIGSLPAGMERHRAALTMPTFEIRTPLPLNGPLQRLGMPDPFDEGVADFTGISTATGHRLYIKAVVHEAFITVDETGTEAAAATAVIINTESAGPVPIVVDRPFLWAIRDVPTGAILFLGRVLDPSIPA